jgi:hypothetical protein
MTLAELASALETLGCPASKSAEMASQLDKRARQLAEKKHRSYDEALVHFAGIDAPGLGCERKRDLDNA